ncbi:MAG: GNAT family N-acetyltransferase [Actinomycetota bacterium]
MTVERNDSTERFETELDGHAAFLTFHENGERLNLIHTEVPDDLEGRGVGSQLVRAALADARERGLKVVPTCPFVRSFLERHPEEQDVLAEPL